MARGAVLVVLGHDGQARVERGLIRAEDEAAPEDATGGQGPLHSGNTGAALK